MLEKLTISGVTLPKIYIAKTSTDIQEAQRHGLPYIVWKKKKQDLIKIIMRPILEKLFPDVLWDKVLGPKERFRTEIMLVDGGECSAITEHGEHEYAISGNEVADIATDYRMFSGGYENKEDEIHYEKQSLETYVGDISSSVNIEVLQKLQLLPKFMGDIVDCIKVNLCNVKWREGYNKKLGAAIGTFGSTKELPNLIILDVSGSIPRGISSTMIALIDTLRHQVKADLIITSDISRYYPYGSELPSPKKLRDKFGYGNEATQFYEILSKYVVGKEWGHVISFGDNDSPSFFSNNYDKQPYLSGTMIHKVHHYHTYRKERTGYALWCSDVAYLGGEEYDTDWCSVIERY